jgi:hypothetical protein
MSTEKTFSLQRGDVLHYRCLAGKPEMILDFACAGCDSFLSLLALDKIENAPLSLGQHPYIIIRTATKASSNEHLVVPVIASQAEEYSYATSSRYKLSVFEAPVVRSLASLGMTLSELQPH